MIPEGEYEVQKVLDNRLTTCKQESWPMYYLHFKCFDDNISYSIIIFRILLFWDSHILIKIIYIKKYHTKPSPKCMYKVILWNTNIESKIEVHALNKLLMLKLWVFAGGHKVSLR